jgi:hypothetical protein
MTDRDAIDKIKRELEAKGIPPKEAEELALLRARLDSSAGDFSSTVAMSKTAELSASAVPAIPFPDDAAPTSSPAGNTATPFQSVETDASGLPPEAAALIAEVRDTLKGAGDGDGDTLRDLGRSLGKLTATPETGLKRFAQRHVREGSKLEPEDVARMREMLVVLAQALEAADDPLRKRIATAHETLCSKS